MNGSIVEEVAIEEVAMNEFELVTIVKRPVTDVFAALQNFGRMPDWTPGLF